MVYDPKNLGFKRKSRDIQKLQQESTLPIINRLPHIKEGRNGDVILSNVAGTLMLHCKANNKWHKVKLETLNQAAILGQEDDQLAGYNHDSGWFDVVDSDDSSSINSNNNYKGVYLIQHNSGSDLVRVELFCRFEALHDGSLKKYTVNLSSHMSSSGPNASRYGYWINIVDSNNLEIIIHPDGLSILHSEYLKDSNDNKSVLIGSDDTSNVGAIELRAFVYSIASSKGKKSNMDTVNARNKNPYLKAAHKPISTGKSVVGDKGAAVDGTKNSSFAIDSDGTGVLLKNDSGTLKVRNLDDDADGDIQCATIKDSNGKKLIEVNPAGSAVNYIKMTNSATTNAPAIAPDGDDTNTDLQIQSKGTGNVHVSIPSTGAFHILDDTSVAITLDQDDHEITLSKTALLLGKMKTDSNGEMKIYNLDGNSATAGAHINISASDNLVLASGSNVLYLYANGTGQNGVTYDKGDWYGTFKLGGGSILHHEATSTSTGYKIDSDLSGDDSQTGVGLQIDLDRTVASSGTNSHLDIGLDIDVNSATLGTGLFYGATIHVSGATSGTSTSTGLYIDSDDSDTNVGIQIKTAGTHIKLQATADPSDDYGTIAVADTGDMTIATFGDGAVDSDLILDIDGGLYIDAPKGQARLQADGGTFTPAHADDIATKAYVDGATYMKHTAVWGGNLGRVAGSGTWLGIPTGYQAAVLQMGTGSSPDTSYTVSTTADDLVSCIWASMHDITVTGCKVWVGQGGATNTGHGVSLMRYDIDADGDLSNGVEVAAGGSLNNDDYSMARAHTMTLSGTAANLDVDFSAGQILIAFVEPKLAYNAAMAGKVILEYTEAET